MSMPTAQTKHHPPLRMEHVVVLGERFTAGQKRCIGYAFTGRPGSKQQAALEQVSPKAIDHRWERIADTMRLPWGSRSRQHTMAELCRRHLVEFICLVMLLLPALIAMGGADQLDMRTRRGGRSRRGGRDTIATLDVDTMSEIDDWPAWITDNSTQGGETMARDTAITTALTPVASIAIGATAGTALYIALSWPTTGHIGTEIAAELAGCALGLITHWRTNY